MGGESVSGYLFMVRYSLKDVECAGRTVSGRGAGEGSTRSGTHGWLLSCSQPRRVHVEMPEQLWEIK